MGCLLSKSRTVRQRSTDGLQLVRKIEQRQFQSGVDQISPEADGRPRKHRRSALGQIGGCPSHSPTKPHTPHPKAIALSLKHVEEDLKGEDFCRGSRTVRAHPRTLRDILHHVLSVFRQISNSCSWISSLERVRVKGSDLFLGHGFLKILGGSCS